MRERRRKKQRAEGRTGRVLSYGAAVLCEQYSVPRNLDADQSHLFFCRQIGYMAFLQAALDKEKK